MFDHVGMNVSDRMRSRDFYALLLETLGQPPVESCTAYDEWNDLALAPRPPSGRQDGAAHRLRGRSRAEVDAFWTAGIEAGHPDGGGPGPRPAYSDAYYGAFLIDPDGNSVEAVHHGTPRTGDGVIDHLWIRVTDLAASRRFWEAVADPLGLSVQDRPGERVQVVRGDRSFALVPGDRPTSGLHLAFPADRAGVAAFHAAALAAGAVDNGGPGERHYHPGYGRVRARPRRHQRRGRDHGGYPG